MVFDSLEIIFVQGERYFLASICEHPVFPEPFIKEILFFYNVYIWHSVENPLAEDVWIYVGVLYSIILGSVSDFNTMLFLLL
jgi:hypothetical protein